MHGPTNVKFHNDVLGAGISHIVQINATQPTDSLVTCIMSHCLNSQPRVVIHIIILYDCNEFKLVSVHDEQVPLQGVAFLWILYLKVWEILKY